MGGLILAHCLKKYAPDVHFDIYESAAELTEVGAGIGMSPRIWAIMKELELEDELLTITGTRDREGTLFPFSCACCDLKCGVRSRCPRPEGRRRAQRRCHSVEPK